jgi:hypothetical protein
MIKSNVYPMHCASRCTAKSKRIGQPCKSPAVRGWAVCQMHGAGGGARSGIAHPNNLHGTRGSEAVALRANIAALVNAKRQID